MKAKASTNRMKKIGITINVLALIFIALSFTGFYLSSELAVEKVYLNITKLLLVFNLTLLCVFRELWKQEKNRIRYSREYTFMVSRK